MPVSSRTTGRRSKTLKARAYPPRFDIPYFAHQRLDPTYFPEAVGLPVGTPPLYSTEPGNLDAGNNAWDDSDEDVDQVNDDESNPGDFYPPPAKRGRHSLPATNGTFQKRTRISGGRPAIAKRVTAELDSDDELIVRMKEAKYLEKDIAQRLIDEGRINYNPKTIGTRWSRIRRAMQERQDKLLDAELTDWHDGDDDVLLQAILKADEEILREKEAIDAKKWRIVADTMKALKPVVNFSHNACRTRYEALQNGTAKPTPESIPNPDASTLERIKSRREKEEKIAQDSMRETFGGFESENVKLNAWTSKSRKYY